MLDTLKIAKRLQKAKFSTEQAEAIAESIAQIAETELATKADLKDLKLRLGDKINRAFLGLLGAAAVTWILQIFGTSLKHFFNLS
jgi:hypothetical protein